jgi:ABC-type sulfate/molybdate transport systems ATPase subunit
MAALARLRVEHLADRPARALSGGEAQRVSLARALACDPAALLLDEPAAGLDGPTRTAFFADLEGALADRSTTVVLVSHQAEEILPLADRVAVVVDGELRQLSAAAELVRAPADAAVARLLGYQNVLDAEVGADGTLLLAGRPTELRAAPGPRPVTLAAWASSVRILPAGDAPLSATVSRVAMGPGRWDVTLRREVELRAQVPFGAAPPSPGEVVAVAFDAAQVAVIDRR